MKLRSAIIKDKELILLPKEEIFSVVKGVWNLSSDQGHLGTLIVTNIRVVWFADLAENFNVAVPYLQFVCLLFAFLFFVQKKMEKLTKKIK